jgi:predicted glycoside hydrolase/deacetylase ChbG (UPF0249 family)
MAAQGSRRSRLIITADDFGRDESCTDAIAESLRAGWITATSIMANATHFEYACQIARRDALMNRLGVHLVLDEGPPLSREMAAHADARGHLCVRRTIAPLGRDLAHAVEAELVAQIEKVLAAGIRPTHLDSHRHIHTAFPIGRLVVRLARRYRIPYVRRARNLATRGGAAANAYKWMFNRYLTGQVRSADHFGDIIDFYQRPGEHDASGLIELMIHLDDTPRGLEQRQLLRNAAFRAFVEQFELVGHAETVH